MKNSFLIIVFVLSLFSKAQYNLVPNWSFEKTDSCISPSVFMLNHLIDWKAGNQGSTDLFTTCLSDVPVNFAGFQYPKTGQNYIGMLATEYGFPNYREYIQTRLFAPLEAGKKYAVGFWCSLGEEECLKACNKLGAFLSDTINDPSTYGTSRIDSLPQIVNDTTHILKDTSSTWMLVTDTIIAKGGEKYITIGNFFDDAHSNVTLTGINYSTSDSSSYYYIDDVFIYCVDTGCDTTWIGIPSTKTQIFDVKVFPNPFCGSTTFSFKQEGNYELKIFDLTGKQIDKKSFSAMKFIYENTKLGSGLYYYEVKNEKNNLSRGKLFFE